MNFVIKSKEVNVSQALNDYIIKRISGLEKFLKFIGPNLIEAQINLKKAIGNQKKGLIYQLNINLQIPGQLFRCERQDDNLYAAIDEAKEELEIEIKKYKTKKETIFIRGARSAKKLYSLSPLDF